MAETERIQERIKEELKLDPIDQEVIVLYKGEKEQESPEFWKVSKFCGSEEIRNRYYFDLHSKSLCV